MRFHGTQQECAEVIAELDATLGYPRGYTQADIDSGLVVRHGRGPHAPIESIRTETVADVEDGVVQLPTLRPEHKERVGRARVLRVLNRGTREQLIGLPGLGAARADAIIARRESGRLVSIEDLRGALPAQAVQALREYAATKVGDEDDAGQLARVEAKKR